VSTGRAITKINLGGEGEEPSILNQQRRAVLDPGWRGCRKGDTLEQLASQGHDFLICPNTALCIADDSVDLVVTNSVRIDGLVLGEPTVQSSEIRRILASGGEWVHDGVARYTKP